MRLVRKSIIRKLFVDFLILALLVGGLVYFFLMSETLEIPVMYVGGILAGFSLFFLGLYYFQVVRPMKLILGEIQKLLAGKPYKRIFSTRIDEIGAIAYFFNKVTQSLGEVSFNLKDRERMIDELAVASQLQRDILPLKTPTVKGLQIVAKNKAATEVGGDSFNVFHAKNKTYIYLGDVTGHGVAAGLIMTMVNSLVSVFSELHDSAFDIVFNVNRYIKRHVKKAMFMTMVMLCWDEDKNKMTYVGAGHEYILVYRANSGECEAVLSGGVALGMVPDNARLIKEREIELNDGDFIVLYSDGITDARNKNGELYGLENLKKAVREFGPQYSADGINYHIAKDVSAFMVGADQWDDMTLIVIKRDANSDVKIDDVAQSTQWND